MCEKYSSLSVSLSYSDIICNGKMFSFKKMLHRSTFRSTLLHSFQNTEIIFGCVFTIIQSKFVSFKLFLIDQIPRIKLYKALRSSADECKSFESH